MLTVFTERAASAAAGRVGAGGLNLGPTDVRADPPTDPEFDHFGTGLDVEEDDDEDDDEEAEAEAEEGVGALGVGHGTRNLLLRSVECHGFEDIGRLREPGVGFGLGVGFDVGTATGLGAGVGAGVGRGAAAGVERGVEATAGRPDDGRPDDGRPDDEEVPWAWVMSVTSRPSKPSPSITVWGWVSGWA